MQEVDDPEYLKNLISTTYPQYFYNDSTIWPNLIISGNQSILTKTTIGAIAYMCIPCFPIYAIIIYSRRKTLDILNSSSAGLILSQTARESHKQLMRALTFQAGIPIFWLTAASIFILLLFKKIEGCFYENLPFRTMELMPMTTPILSIYLVKPYRIIIQNWIAKDNSKLKSVTFVSTMATSSRI
ncbi:unnamed protein product [Caenorhabditis angaria]|uniref:Uncharacterized protein n=1 Tax=Caenorhabditis angaria TaxID=860376 RepID=A0A9P1IQ92_9PELO|nr:unnamed protein product [Caenorhabditis angaria]